MSSSSPNVGTDVLRTLHRIHRQLGDLKGRQDRGPKRIRAAEANVAHCREQLEKVREATTNHQVATNKKQQQLDAGETKIRELKGKLNTASSNREYQSFQEQIAAAEMANSVLADEILEGFEKIDQFQGKVGEAEKVVEQAEQKLAKIRAEVEKELPRIEGDIARLQGELKESESALPGPVRELYERVVRHRGDDALASVENNYCSGCNTQIPLNVIAQIMLAQPMFCRTCGRMLYTPEDFKP